MEIWKAVKGYENYYEVSNLGNVRSVDRSVRTTIKYNDTRVLKSRALKLHLKHNGYYMVDLSKEGEIHSKSVHRLVAEAFIPNPNNLKVVNHIDGVKTNNNVENLEWVTYQENHWHARNTGLLNNIGQHNNKTVYCVDTQMTFKNSAEAAKWLIESKNQSIKVPNIKTISKNIRGAVTGRTPRAYGYEWKDV